MKKTASFKRQDYSVPRCADHLQVPVYQKHYNKTTRSSNTSELPGLEILADFQVSVLIFPLFHVDW